jgi:hypothetical protein
LRVNDDVSNDVSNYIDASDDVSNCIGANEG